MYTSELRGRTPRGRTIPALLELQAEAHGDRVLVRTAEGSRTFAGARDTAAGYASQLAEAGIASGDRVALLSENRLECVGLWLATAWLGGVPGPCNTGPPG